MMMVEPRAKSLGHYSCHVFPCCLVGLVMMLRQRLLCVEFFFFFIVCGFFFFFKCHLPFWDPSSATRGHLIACGFFLLYF